MKVVHLISHFDMGGAERVAASIAKSNNAEVEYHVVEVMRGHSAYTNAFLMELKGAGIHCHRSWMPDVRFHFLVERLAALLFPLTFLSLFLKLKPDVIHVHTEGPDMCAVAFFKVFPWLKKHCRIVRTIHNTCLWTGQSKIGRAVETFYQKHGVNVAISKGVAEKYVEVYGGAEPTIVYNGVCKVEQKAYKGVRKDKINVIFSGRFERQKGISTLIETIKGLPEDSLYHFHIFGDGSLREEIEAALGGKDNVSINPPLFWLSSYLASFDYMIMPSAFEGLSIVAIEAAMAGLPNIISDIAGLKETLPIDWPLKASAGDAQAFINLFTEKIPRLGARNDSEYERLSTQAKEHVEELFSIATMQTNYEAIYDDRQG